MRKILLHIIFVGLLGFLLLFEYWLPWVQPHVYALQAPRLMGQNKVTYKPSMTLQSYTEGKYQARFKRYIKSFSPTIDLWVRARNQWIYAVFGEVASTQMCMGTEGYWYSHNYCQAYVGIDAWSKQKAEQYAQRIRRIDSALYAQNGTRLMIWLPPSKPRCMPAYLPKAFRQQVVDTSSWGVLSDALQASDVAYTNFDYLHAAHSPKSYQTHSVIGSHWNSYGRALVADSMQSRIGRLLGMQLPTIVWDSIVEREAYTSGDVEYLNIANLYTEPSLPIEPHVYLSYHETDSTTKPYVVIIGDSYYELIYKDGIQEGLFDARSTSWYYNYKPMPKRDKGKDGRVKKLQEELQGCHLFIISVAECNYQTWGFGILEQLEKILFSPQ